MTLTTLVGNVSPLSPTSADAWRQAPRDDLVLSGRHLTGTGVNLTIERGHAKSHVDQLKAFSVEEPFSLAYGGGGGGYGGQGGVGFNGSFPTGAATRQGAAYGDPALSRGLLLGGSGGQLGYPSPHAIASFTQPTSRGGEGGGAIAVVAVNDLILGSHARLSVNGGRGRDGHTGGGGGGSGGTLHMTCGGITHFEPGSRLEARGGDGGRTGGQPRRTSRTFQRRYGDGLPGDPARGGGADAWTASDFANGYAGPVEDGSGGDDGRDGNYPEGGYGEFGGHNAVPAALTAKQERQLANLAKQGLNRKSKSGSGGAGGVSTRHIASMRAKMIRGASFEQAHKLALQEETTAQKEAEVVAKPIERAGGGGGGGRIALYAHAMSLETQRALWRMDLAAQEEAEANDLLSGGGVRSTAKARPGGDTGTAQGNGGDGGERLDSGWRPRDGVRGSGSNQEASHLGSDGSLYRGTGSGWSGGGVYDVGGGRCVLRTWGQGPQNGTFHAFAGQEPVNASSSPSAAASVAEARAAGYNGSIVYLGPNETAALCPLPRQGARGSFHVEVDTAVAVQVCGVREEENRRCLLLGSGTGIGPA